MEFQPAVSRKLAGNPQEGSDKAGMVFTGTQIVAPNNIGLFAREGDLLELHLAISDVNFVPTEGNWDVLVVTTHLTVPVGDVLVGDTTADIKHDNCTLRPNAASAARSPGPEVHRTHVPDIEDDRATVSEKLQTEDGNS